MTMMVSDAENISIGPDKTDDQSKRLMILHREEAIDPGTDQTDDQSKRLMMLNGEKAIDPETDSKSVVDARADPSYWNLISENHNFMWFLLSYFVTHLGEWTTYVASISILEEQMGKNNRIILSMLVVTKMAPNTLLSIPGGILADSRDRKKIMLSLDVLGAVVALLYLSAVHSVYILFACTILQESLSGLYEPSRSAMMPLLVSPEYLPKANAVSAIAWSLTASVGSSLGGFLVSKYGPTACFLTDSCMYVVSALILAVLVKGNFDVSCKDPSKKQTNALRELVDFLRVSDSSAFVLIKACGALLFGASDVVNVTFSQVDGILDSQRLGWMFAAMGVGCLLGPLLVPDKRNYLKTCIVAYALVGIGYGLIASFANFWSKCFWTILRASGAAILWVDSSIVIQTSVPETILGRVCAIDVGLALLGEALSALLAGVLQDHGVSATQVAYLLCGMGLFWVIVWSVYYNSHRVKGIGLDESNDDVEMEPLHKWSDDDRSNKSIDDDRSHKFVP